PHGIVATMTPPIPIQVYGINLLVRLMVEGPADVRVHCPKGSPIRYGEVIARGDGFDEGANAFREMPELKVVVAFEESAEEVEGHYFYIAGEEYRVIRLDSVILSFPHEESSVARAGAAAIEAALSCIDERELVDLTRDLIRIPSVVRPGDP